MSKVRRVSVLITILFLLLLLLLMSLEANAQSTVDADDASCRSPTLDQVLNLIGKHFADAKNQAYTLNGNVNKIGKDLTGMKKLILGSQPKTTTSASLSLCEYNTQTPSLYTDNFIGFQVLCIYTECLYLLTFATDVV